jgi:plastocyanin
MRLCYGLSLALLAACGGSSYSTSNPPPPPPPPAPPPPPGTTAVGISGNQYSPDTITIAQGTNVRWTNQDAISHTVVADSGGFTSGTLGGTSTDQYGYPTAGSSYDRVFNSTGTIGYHCTIHAGMKGAVIVTP